ncbi:two-component system sensor histidine kinase BaeS [Saccharothrix coeruleofusca]|uniref:sensor histidine kinase n=1 Tax=Saccharothrix coeruleofusca TaxID=33919 RepID=UPI001FD3E424|nr:HAMP domain-containing sensor histidine kinase [Saccharothrix coeruleofusca]MBP2336829.1 two-component system sensor histidine kinase BaeS [Saccharothrix coeruleofusca]
MSRRHSLLVRFFAVSALIAACSIAVTAWLATQATTGSIRQEQGEALATDATLYDELLGYAATHPDWSEVGPTVRALAARHGRRIALTTKDREPIADSGGPGAPPLPVTPKVVVDPLNVDPALKAGGTDEIDPRAVGPLKLTEQESADLQRKARALAECTGARISTRASGRPHLEWPTSAAPGPPCTVEKDLDLPVPTEVAANTDLLNRAAACAERSGKSFAFDPQWPRLTVDVYRSAARLPPETAQCLTTARREQLIPYVAQPALLFLTAPTGAEPATVDLSTAGVTRIALTGAAILAVAGFAAWLTAMQLARPIRALTSAAQRMGAGDRTVRVEEAKGELGELARAFNTMSAALAETERQRRALISDVAHELRTPLGNVTGWLEATQDGLATPDPELISMLLEEALLLQHLVTDLQDLARADAGTLRLHREAVDADEVIGQAVAAHRAEAEVQGVALRAESRSGLFLHADPVRLRQALGNLVTNAVRYTPAGGTITVTGRAEGESVVVEVVDTGVGIHAEDLPRVFDRFWRADKSRSRTTGGSGLGLAITRQLVEMHGGEVSVTSTPGAGTTFRLVLPRLPVV